MAIYTEEQKELWIDLHMLIEDTGDEYYNEDKTQTMFYWSERDITRTELVAIRRALRALGHKILTYKYVLDKNMKGVYAHLLVDIPFATWQTTHFCVSYKIDECYARDYESDSDDESDSEKESEDPSD